MAAPNSGRSEFEHGVGPVAVARERRWIISGDVSVINAEHFFGRTSALARKGFNVDASSKVRHELGIETRELSDICAHARHGVRRSLPL